MTTQPIVSKVDIERLQPLLDGTFADAPVLRLRSLLERARVVDPEQVPPDIVTMNSQVLVQYSGEGSAESLVLAYPDATEADAISVLSPLGAALLGAREGESVTRVGASKARNVTVERIVYQPERERHFER